MKLVVFDLDGTLLDTLQDLTLSCNYALQQHSLPQRSQSEIRSFIGDGAFSLIQRAMPLQNQQDTVLTTEVLHSFRDYYAKHRQDHTRPYDGVIPMLTELKSNNVKIAVLSNKPHSDTLELTNQYFPCLIDLSFGQRDGVPKKPDPQALLEILNYFQLPNTSCCYVGDSVNDVLTGRNAQISNTIAVSWGFTNRPDLETTGAVIVNTVDELIQQFSQ